MPVLCIHRSAYKADFIAYTVHCATILVLQPDSCGYGVVPPSVSTEPHLASLSRTSPLLAGLPANGCGACVQVTCTDPAPVRFKLRASSCSTAILLKSLSQSSLIFNVVHETMNIGKEKGKWGGGPWWGNQG